MPDNNDPQMPPGDSAPTERMPPAGSSTKQNTAVKAPRLQRNGRRQTTDWDRVEQALTSLFFIALGIAFLYAAYKTMYEAHATFSFVLVVVGVAILLYGTGTQGAGNFNSDVGAVTYKIGIAGGAGILALSIGWGVLKYSQKMRDAFQIEKRYVRLQIMPQKGISEVNFVRYVPDVTTTSGEIVPSLRRGNHVEIYVPYLPTESQKILDVKLLHVVSDNRPPQLKVVYENQYSIDIIAGGFGGTYGGQDFPLFSGKITASHGANGGEESQNFMGIITVDLVDPKQQAKEQENPDKQQQQPSTNAEYVPPPTILRPTGAM